MGRDEAVVIVNGKCLTVSDLIKDNFNTMRREYLSTKLEVMRSVSASQIEQSRKHNPVIRPWGYYK